MPRFDEMIAAWSRLLAEYNLELSADGILLFLSGLLFVALVVLFVYLQRLIQASKNSTAVARDRPAQALVIKDALVAEVRQIFSDYDPESVIKRNAEIAAALSRAGNELKQSVARLEDCVQKLGRQIHAQAAAEEKYRDDIDRLYAHVELSRSGLSQQLATLISHSERTGKALQDSVTVLARASDGNGAVSADDTLHLAVSELAVAAKGAFETVEFARSTVEEISASRQELAESIAAIRQIQNDARATRSAFATMVAEIRSELEN